MIASASARHECRRALRYGGSISLIETGLGKGCFGGVEADLNGFLLQNEPVNLTQAEYRLLAVLIANATRVVASPQQLREVGGDTFGVQSLFRRYHEAMAAKAEGQSGAPEIPAARPA